jgi:molybdopterin molybdotransferase
MPQGAERVVIQEDVTRDGAEIVIGDRSRRGAPMSALRRRFPQAGARIEAPRRLSPADLALAAAMNAPVLTVTRRPVVALIATGDELVLPGEDPRADQIVASNTYGLKALIEAEGGMARMLPIARDDEESLRAVFDLAQGADLIVTVGGASVGDHDLVGAVAEGLGLERAFYKIAMRPGKPLMAGRLGDAALLGLPGNPVSALVCGHLFLVPMLRAFLGPARRARGGGARRGLGADLAPNGPREHYMRAEVFPTGEVPEIVPFGAQDSSLLSILSRANGLLVRPVGDPERKAGELVDYVPIGPIAT